MGRVALSFIFALLFGATLLYAQVENPEPITVNLGTLAKGWRPYLFEIALFPALILFLFAFLLSFSRPGSKEDKEQKQALEAAQARLREQEERLTALEAQLRTVGMLPLEPAAAEAEEDHGSSSDAAAAAPIPPKETPADDAPRIRVSRAVH